MSYIPEGEIKELLQSGAAARLLDVETRGASGLMNAGVRSSTYYVTR
jgi:hypothetical protein